VISAALDGKVPTYPGSDLTDPENDPKTYLRRQYDQFASGGRVVTMEDMLMTLELEYDGMAYPGYSKMTPRHLDLTFADTQLLLPDRNMGRIYMKDLVGFKVPKGKSMLPLPQYLESRHFEHYVIRVYSPQDTFGIRTHADARSVQQKLDQGQITDLLPN
jgi:hypothetical protein